MACYVCRRLLAREWPVQTVKTSDGSLKVPAGGMGPSSTIVDYAVGLQIGFVRSKLQKIVSERIGIHGRWPFEL